MKRIIVIVPSDAQDSGSEFFRNFVWRVRRAIEVDKLDARVVVAWEVPIEAPR